MNSIIILKKEKHLKTDKENVIKTKKFDSAKKLQRKGRRENDKNAKEQKRNK